FLSLEPLGAGGERARPPARGLTRDRGAAPSHLSGLAHAIGAALAALGQAAAQDPAATTPRLLPPHPAGEDPPLPRPHALRRAPAERSGATPRAMPGLTVALTVALAVASGPPCS